MGRRARRGEREREYLLGNYITSPVDRKKGNVGEVGRSRLPAGRQGFWMWEVAGIGWGRGDGFGFRGALQVETFAVGGCCCDGL
jgi:hypothetical protein